MKISNYDKLSGLLWLQNALVFLICSQLYKVVYYVDFAQYLNTKGDALRAQFIWNNVCSSSEECWIPAFPMIFFSGHKTPLTSSYPGWLLVHLIVSVIHVLVIRFSNPLNPMCLFILSAWITMIFSNATSFVGLEPNVAMMINLGALLAILFVTYLYYNSVYYMRYFIRKETFEDDLRDGFRNFANELFENALALNLKRLVYLFVIGFPVWGEIAMIRFIDFQKLIQSPNFIHTGALIVYSICVLSAALNICACLGLLIPAFEPKKEKSY